MNSQIIAGTAVRAANPKTTIRPINVDLAPAAASIVTSSRVAGEQVPNSTSKVGAAKDRPQHRNLDRASYFSVDQDPADQSGSPALCLDDQVHCGQFRRLLCVEPRARNVADERLKDGGERGECECNGEARQDDVKTERQCHLISSGDQFIGGDQGSLRGSPILSRFVRRS
jgi:hypothetical protein